MGVELEEAASCTCRLFHSSKRGRRVNFSEVQTILAHERERGRRRRERERGTVKREWQSYKKRKERECRVREGELFA